MLDDGNLSMCEHEDVGAEIPATTCPELRMAARAGTGVGRRSTNEVRLIRLPLLAGSCCSRSTLAVTVGRSMPNDAE